MDGPVFLALELLDLDLAFDDEAQGGALYPAGGEAAANLAPQQGREVEAHQVVERAARLLGVDHVHGDVARRGDGGLDRRLGDLVEHHALQDLALEQPLGLEDFRQMPGDGLPLAVRVGCEVDGVGFLDRLGDGVDVLGVALDEFVLHGERVVGVHGALLGHQIAHVAVGGEHFEVLAKVFFQRFRLGGRFDDQEGIGHKKRSVP